VACAAGATALLAARAGPLDQAAHTHAVVTALINDILETLPDPFLRVLDDLHLMVALPDLTGLLPEGQRTPSADRYVVAHITPRRIDLMAQ
jgi:hypothetical protein